ncbi:MAG: dockerin type I repeat-containing protein [Ruminococcus sp.]|nr:dockerin type I repeat-containing protein [Ruminococcus sp.]
MKKVLLILLVAIMIMVSTFCVAAKETDILGDVNNDGVVSIIDATQIQCYLVDLTDADEIDVSLADVDGDGDITIMDATAIQLYLAQIIDKFPGENASLTPPSVDSDGYYDQIVKP